MRFHHLGVACSDLEIELNHFQGLGYCPEGESFRDPIQNVQGMFLTGPGPRLELLAPLDETSPGDSPLGRYLQNGIKYYHQAFEVASIKESLQELTARGGRIVSPPESGVAFAGRPIAFVMLPGMILIEVIQGS